MPFISEEKKGKNHVKSVIEQVQIYSLISEQCDLNLRSEFLFHQQNYYLAKESSKRRQNCSNSSKIRDKC